MHTVACPWTRLPTSSPWPTKPLPFTRPLSPVPCQAGHTTVSSLLTHSSHRQALAHAGPPGLESCCFRPLGSLPTSHILAQVSPARSSLVVLFKTHLQLPQPVSFFLQSPLCLTAWLPCPPNAGRGAPRLRQGLMHGPGTVARSRGPTWLLGDQKRVLGLSWLLTEFLKPLTSEWWG